MRWPNGNPLSFLHVSRAEIDLPANTDPYSDAVYRKAVENFETLKTQAPLVVEEAPEPVRLSPQDGEPRADGHRGNVLN